MKAKQIKGFKGETLTDLRFQIIVAMINSNPNLYKRLETYFKPEETVRGMQVKKRTFETWQEAITFAQQKLNKGYGNIRIITAKSKLANRYNIKGEQAQVRYW